MRASVQPAIVKKLVTSHETEVSTNEGKHACYKDILFTNLTRMAKLNFDSSLTMKATAPCRLAFILAVGGLHATTPFTSALVNGDVARSRLFCSSRSIYWTLPMSVVDDDDEMDPRRRSQQEKMLEQASQIGADKIATLSIPERTKRAMLAEAIEDELFVATEQLEDLYNQSSTSPSTASISNDDNAETRKTAVELAKRIRSLQAQYNELVSGGSSSVLNVLESALASDDDDSDDDDDDNRIDNAGTLE